MYSYEWDIKTGGYRLINSQLKFSREPRPVYYRELDMLGFDKYWNYPKNDTYPIMWAEANKYYYYGKCVAKTKGGTMYSPPEIIVETIPEINKTELNFVDIEGMVEANKEILESLIQDTIKKVYNTYREYRDNIDIFYVAFSGGKDSIALLDIVQRTLPHNEFKVLFADTGMEFPDTYTTINEIKKNCENENIEFITAKSHFLPEQTWNIFGIPATVTRWCHSVHKTAPQILTLRKVLNKHDFTGMAFIGIRGDESIARSKYEYLSKDENHKGQLSCNPILEWNSAELYLYSFSRQLIVNEAYKKGNRRVGCLLCPRAAERNEYICHECYPKEFEKFSSIIVNQYKDNFNNEEAFRHFIEVGGWKARKNGRDISLELNYSENKDKQSNTIIKIENQKVDWKIWIKTIGELLTFSSPYKILFKGKTYTLDIKENNNDIEMFIPNSLSKKDPLFVKLLKNVFRRAACCIGCNVCEADCKYGCISMENGEVKISDECTHCAKCHKIDKGCWIYKSLEMPKGGFRMKKNMSLNSYSHHAPKMEWFEQYFEYKNEFNENHSLGSQMYSFFKRFLRDAKLLDEIGFSKTAKVVESIGLDNNVSWAIMLANLVYAPQLGWYVSRTKFGETYSKEYIKSMLVDDGAKESWSNDIWSSLVRILDLPFGKIGLGYVNKEKKRAVSITRTKWEQLDALVILYSLYKFAEVCGDYYQFTLSRLLNTDIDSYGVSPTEIYGIDRQTMEQLLNGLSINYPEYIAVSFTHDLDNITLRSEKKSEDILNLFMMEE